MAGKTRRLSHCRLPRHGTHCEVARERLQESMGRAAEKRQWKRQETP